MIKDCFLNTTRNHTFNSNGVRVRLRSNCFKDFWLVFRTMPFSILGAASRGVHASLAGNVFSTQKRLADETTYEHTRNLFFKVIRKSLYIDMLMTVFLTIFRRFPTTFRRFPKICQNCSEGRTNAPEQFPKISEDARRLPKIAEDFRGRPEDVSMIHQRI